MSSSSNASQAWKRLSEEEDRRFHQESVQVEAWTNAGMVGPPPAPACTEHRVVPFERDWNAHVVTIPGGSASVIAMSQPHVREISDFVPGIAHGTARNNPYYRSSDKHSDHNGSTPAIIVKLNGDDNSSSLSNSSDRWIPPYGQAPTMVQASPEYGSSMYKVKTTKPPTVTPELGSILSDIDISLSGKESEVAPTHVYHYNYTEWPDCQVPNAGESMEHLHNLVAHVAQLRKQMPEAITYVHCEAGWGRTGTFTGLLLQHESGYTIPREELVRQMRQCRESLVWNKRQFNVLSE